MIAGEDAAIICEDPERTGVRFAELASPAWLWKQNPHYQELLDLVRSALGTGRLLWFVVKGSTIVDIKALSPVENNALIAWMKHHAQRAADACLATP